MQVDYCRNDMISSPVCRTEEQQVTSTPIGLGAAPSFERMTPSPPPARRSPMTSQHHQMPVNTLSIHLHGSSLGAGGITPYNTSSTSVSLYPLNGLSVASKQILATNAFTNGIVTSSNMHTSNGPIHRQNTRNVDYHTTYEHARINGIVPEIIRGGEVVASNDTKGSNRPHNSTTNQVILGEAGGFKSMLWVEDKPRETLNGVSPDVCKPSGSGCSIRSTSSSSGNSSNSPSSSRRSTISPGSSILANNYFRGTSSPNNGARNGACSSSPHSISPIQTLSEDLNDSLYNKIAPNPIRQMPINMERLWQRDHRQHLTQPQASADTTGNGVRRTGTFGNDRQTNHGNSNVDDDDDDNANLICMICDDTATGLHYGIITCEG